MLESTLRVNGTKKDDWTITKQPAQERYFSGIKDMQEGKCISFIKMMYTRVFYPDGCGDFEHNKVTLNSLLDLPEEDIDEVTKFVYLKEIYTFVSQIDSFAFRIDTLAPQKPRIQPVSGLF